jgi:SAM-dependent methyltransferase
LAPGRYGAAVATVYDEVPYPNQPFSQTRPSVLATVAALHGLHAPDPRRARILELGCGRGANLAGLATADPHVRAVGVDLAPTAIEAARETARAAGLENVRFEVADVTDLVDGRLGEFDYVIAHGFYSWTPEEVRGAALAATRAHLAPDGLAYFSYVANPGGHLRQMLREMGYWHARGIEAPLERAERARRLFGLLDSLQGSAGPSFYAGALADDVHALAGAPLEMLVHDLMQVDYAPMWFVDFAAAARAHDLEHVADALPEGSREPPWSPAVAEFVDEAAGDDPIAREQYFDILVMRRFRQSLLCRAGRRPSPRVERAAIPLLLVSARGAGAGEPRPLLAAALDGLAHAGGPVPFERLRDGLEAPADALVDALLEGFNSGHVGFQAFPASAAAAAGPRPRASALARTQARPGAFVTTLLNQLVRISDEPTSQLLGLLDGTRDRAAIARDFSGELSAEALDAALEKFAELGLLHE